MCVTRGLIIADPWIGHILDGRKDWEMRSQATSVRGWFGLIQKGSGTVVGLARLVDCGRTLDQAEMITNFDHHRIPVDMIRRGEVAKWIVPWKLADVIPLVHPIPYEHKSGAVTWVTLSPDVSQKLAPYISPREQVGDTDQIAEWCGRAVDATETDGREREPGDRPCPHRALRVDDPFRAHGGPPGRTDQHDAQQRAASGPTGVVEVQPLTRAHRRTE